MPFAVVDFHSLLSNTWVAFLVILFFGGSIFVHELGHFLAARRCGVKVERFSIGFGPAIWSRRGRDGVEYRVSWFPLGGYVLLPQLVDLGPIEGKSEADVKLLPPVGYGAKMFVFVAGAFFNILLAFALACIIWVMGQPESNQYATTRIGYVMPTLDMADGSKVPGPAAEAGLRAGDVVRAIDGQKVTDWFDLAMTLGTGAGRDGKDRPRAVFTIDRDGQPLDVVLYPRLSGDDKIRKVGIASAFPLIVSEVDHGSLAEKAGLKVGDEILRLDDDPMLNDMAFVEHLYSNRDKPVSARVRRAGQEMTLLFPARPGMTPTADFGLAFSSGLHLTHPSPFIQIRDQVTMTFRELGSLLNPHSDVGLSKMSGPIGIVHMLSSAAETGLWAVLSLTVLINVNLAILNLLPVPVLDGGQMLFATIGRVRRRALPANFIVTTQGVFMVLLFSMIIYISYFNVRSWARDVRSDRAAAAAPKTLN